MTAKEWLKSALVAAGGGTCAAISAAIMDPRKFNLSDGIKDEVLITVQGALVGLAALFIRSPLGSSMIAAIEKSKQQSSKDADLLKKIQQDVTKP